MRANSQQSALSLAFRSYLKDWQRWIGSLTTRYMLAVCFTLLGVVALLASIGVGVAAAFHFVELKYGVWIAYASVGGALFFSAMLSLAGGGVLLRRSVPAFPRPNRQFDVLERYVTVPVVARLMSNPRPEVGLRADGGTRALAAAAAVMFIGWLTVSRLDRRPDGIRD